MKILFIILGVIVVIPFLAYLWAGSEASREVDTNVTTTEATSVASETDDEVQEGIRVTPISHASLVLNWDGQTIYSDPVGGEEMFDEVNPPELILITDIHGDHLSTSTLTALFTNDVLLIAPQAVADRLPAPILERTMVLANKARTTLKGFSIEAIPMYNLPESDDSRHAKGRGNGYVIERDGTRVYIAGDTADIPEMRDLQDIDIAFIPMNLPYTMGVEAAADAVLEFVPNVVYPFHYRGQDGLADTALFKELVNQGNPDIEVVLRNWYPASEDTEE